MHDSDIDLAHAFALGNLDESEQQEVDALLAGSDDRRTEFDATVRQTLETLAVLSSATSVQPPAELRARLLADIAAEKPVQEPTSLAKHRSHADRSRSDRWRLAVGASAAAVLVLIAGVFIGQQLRDTEQVSTVDAVLAATDARAATTPLESGGSATVVYSRHADAAVVVLNDAQKPPDDKVFQMWLIAGTTNPVSAGVIDQDQMATTTTTTVGDVGNATTFAVTVEPPGGSPQPTTTPFVAIPLA